MKAVAYCRFSSDNQREESIDAQIRAIKDYCSRKDIELIKVYADEGISGTTDDRPAFQEMIAASEAGLFNYVIVHKLDRFSRSKYDSTIYKRKLKLNNVSVLSVLENLDDSPESLILESVLEGMSEYYSRNLSREVKKGQNENALKCLHNGGTPPLGYDVSNKQYVINEYEAAAVRIIFKMFAAGNKYDSIINTLNERGFKTKKGNNFNKNSLYDILGNEKYAGIYTYRKRANLPFSKTTNNHKYNKKYIKIENGIPAIIEKSLFDKVQKMRKNNRRKSQIYKSDRIYPLSGLVFCECGSAMHGQTSTNYKRNSKYHYYRCSNKECNCKMVNADNLEDAVIKVIDDLIFNQENKKLLAKNIYENILKNSDKDKIKTLEKEYFENNKKLNNLINALASGIDASTLKNEIEKLENKKTELLQMIEQESIENSETKFKDITEWLKHEDLSSFSQLELKNIFNMFIEKITITNRKVVIKLKYISLKNSVYIGGDGAHQDVNTISFEI